MSSWIFKSGVVSIWLGYFESEDDFLKYMKKKFKKDFDIGNPKGVWWDIYDEEILPIEELIGSCDFSKSYVDELIKNSRRLDQKEFNTCIVRFNMATDKSFDDKDKDIKFICTAQYDSSSMALYPEDEIDYEVEGRVSVWAGEFANEAECTKYFKEVGEDDEYQSMFAEDFKIDFYDHDFMELLNSVGFCQESIEHLIKHASYSQSFSKPAIKVAKKKGIKLANTLLLLYDFDYSLLSDDGIEQKGMAQNFRFIGTINYSKE